MVRFAPLLIFACVVLSASAETPLQVDITEAVKCPDEEKAAKSDKVSWRWWGRRCWSFILLGFLSSVTSVLNCISNVKAAVLHGAQKAHDK